jgi:hypothetical protein
MQAGEGLILTVMVIPDGSGPDFSEAADINGIVFDATIEVILRDELGSTIALYPMEDIWLELGGSSDDRTICNTGSYGQFSPLITMDANLDRNGVGHFFRPQHMGGYVEGPVFVLVNGDRLRSNDGFSLRFNSPDISGDGDVNLTDVQIFAEDFYGGYHFRSDLAHDGVVNLSDVAKIAQHMGASCP